MHRVWSFVISTVLLLTLGMAQLPLPCMGDGHGGACFVSACQCVAACSCHHAHELEKAELAKQAVPECCQVEGAAACHASPHLAASSCHGPKQWPHFSLPSKHWFAIAPDLNATLAFEASPELTVQAPPAVLASSLAPPEKPPRHFV
jgi:hypothetical protein